MQVVVPFFYASSDRNPSDQQLLPTCSSSDKNPARGLLSAIHDQARRFSPTSDSINPRSLVPARIGCRFAALQMKIVSQYGER
jgi:hypothetical protein